MKSTVSKGKAIAAASLGKFDSGFKIQAAVAIRSSANDNEDPFFNERERTNILVTFAGTRAAIVVSR